MDNPEYEKFLLDIADDVAELVAVSENRKRFEQHSCDLGKKQALYSQARKRAAKQWKTALAKPLPDRISYLKSKGWNEVEVKPDLTPVGVYFYGKTGWNPPEMPYDPLSGFLSVLTHDKDIPDVVSRPKIDEALAYYYFSLATIHDKMRDDGYIPIHNNSEAKQLAKSVWATIEKLCVDRQFILKTALDHVKTDISANKPTETKQNHKTTIIAIIISLFIICIFEFLVNIIPLTWLKNHPNSYALQSSISCLIACFIFRLCKPKWRKLCWACALIALGVLLSQLGGPADSNVN